MYFCILILPIGNWLSIKYYLSYLFSFQQRVHYLALPRLHHVEAVYFTTHIMRQCAVIVMKQLWTKIQFEKWKVMYWLNENDDQGDHIKLIINAQKIIIYAQQHLFSITKAFTFNSAINYQNLRIYDHYSAFTLKFQQK